MVYNNNIKGMEHSQQYHVGKYVQKWYILECTVKVAAEISLKYALLWLITVRWYSALLP